jgi:FlaA1/EpsC-like NDP-sugar epimerase
MPVIRIEDLADVMIEELAPFYGHDPEDLSVNVIGTKPGEKMYEELMSGEETRRAWELERYFVILPAFTSPYRKVVYRYQDLQSKMVTNPYHSGNEKPLTKDQLRAFLRENNLFHEDPEQARHPSERFWPNGSDKKDTDVQVHKPMPREKITRIHGTA